MNVKEKISAQIDAMEPFLFLEGHWEGQKTEFLPDGEHHTSISQDIGRPELSGGVMTVAGRSYPDGPDGEAAENFGVFVFDPESQDYIMHSHAKGLVRRGRVTVCADGSIQVLPQGPDSTVRLTMKPLTTDSWYESGERRTDPDSPWRPFFEITFKRMKSA